MANAEEVNGRPTDDPWEWKLSEPERWEPRVGLYDNSAVVTLLTHSVLGEERISRIVDRFSIGSCVFESEVECLATGPGGYVH